MPRDIWHLLVSQSFFTWKFGFVSKKTYPPYEITSDVKYKSVLNKNSLSTESYPVLKSVKVRIPSSFFSIQKSIIFTTNLTFSPLILSLI